MPPRSDQPTMRQKIFSMGLDVEAVSLYLLCCAVADAGAPITRATLTEKWNGTPSSLQRELEQLEDRNILCSDTASPENDRVYRFVDEKQWR